MVLSLTVTLDLNAYEYLSNHDSHFLVEIIVMSEFNIMCCFFLNVHNFGLLPHVFVSRIEKRLIVNLFQLFWLKMEGLGM